MDFYDIPNPKLNAKNGHFGNKYATLEEVIKTVRPYLKETGYQVIQTVQLQDILPNEGKAMFVSQLVQPVFKAPVNSLIVDPKVPSLPAVEESVSLGLDLIVIREVAFPWDPGKAGPQAVGSALTYARRYGYLLLFDLVGEEDDDGERAEGRGGKKPSRKSTYNKTENEGSDW